MLRRLRIYFTGFGIGLLLVYVIFMRDDSRDLDIWTPSQRILEEIRADSTFLHSDRLTCFKQCLEVDSITMHLLWKDSEVSSLNPGGNPYRYSIVLKTDDQHLEAELEKTEGYALIYLKDHLEPKACSCD